MGLDIYLYKYDNKAETDRLEAEYSEKSEALWTKKYEQTSEKEKDGIRKKSKAIANKLGLDEYGNDKTRKHCIEIDSDIDKDHYFKIGYFRSSYNGGGINNVLRNLGVPDLVDIFGYRDEYAFRPNWESSLKKVKQTIELLESKGNYRVFDVSPNIFVDNSGPADPKQALDLYLTEIGKNHFNPESEGYSNINGYFYPSGLKVLGIIPGQQNLLGHRKCVYVVIEGENQWYITALKIVQETIEYVLNQKDKELYYFHWSG